MSAKLAKLRDAFSDPLFVRQRRGLSPTPRAQELAPQILSALGSCREAFAHPTAFAPASAEGTVIIGGTDYLDILILPQLIHMLEREAPGIRLVTKNVRPDLPKSDFEEGTIDIAIAGFFSAVPDGYYRQTLFNESYLCAVRAGHPRIKRKLTPELYLSHRHLLISPGGDLTGVVDKVLAERNLKRTVVAGIGNFHAPGPVVAQSDLVITGPRRLIESYSGYLPLRTFEPPFPVPGFSVTMIWHERTNKDPLRKWIRSRIRDISGRAGKRKPPHP